MCEFCEEKFPVVTHYGKFKIDKLSNKPVITCDLNKCPPFAVCSSKDMNVEMAMEQKDKEMGLLKSRIVQLESFHFKVTNSKIFKILRFFDRK